MLRQLIKKTKCASGYHAVDTMIAPIPNIFDLHESRTIYDLFVAFFMSSIDLLRFNFNLNHPHCLPTTE